MTTTQQETLKPCPFCGSRVIRENGVGTDPSDAILHVAKPGGNNCPVADGFNNWNCEGDVSDLWNTRSISEEEVGRLRDALDEIAHARWPSVNGDDPVKRIQGFAREALSHTGVGE